MSGKVCLSLLLVTLLASEVYGKLGSGVFYHYVRQDGATEFYGDTGDIYPQVDTNANGEGSNYVAPPGSVAPGTNFDQTYGPATFSAELQFTARMVGNVIKLDDYPQIDGTLCQGTDTMILHTNAPIDISTWGENTGILGPYKFSCTPINGRMTQFAIKIKTISAIVDGSFTVTYTPAIVEDFFDILTAAAQPNFNAVVDPAAPAAAPNGAQGVFGNGFNEKTAQVFNKRGKWSWNALPKEVYNIGETITASWNPGSNKKIKLRLLKRIIRPIIFGRGYSKELQKWKLGKGVREQSFEIKESHASSFYVYFQIQKGCIPLVGICDQVNSDQFTILGKGFKMGWNYDPNSQTRQKAIPLFHIGCKNGHRNTTGNPPPAGSSTASPEPDLPTNPTGDPTGIAPDAPPPPAEGSTGTQPPPPPADPTPPPPPADGTTGDGTTGDGGEGGEGGEGGKRTDLEVHHQRELERRGFCEHGSYNVDLTCSNCYVQGNGNYYKLSIGLKGVSVYAVGEFTAVATLNLFASLHWGVKGNKVLMDIPLIATPRFSVLGFHFGFGIYATASIGWSVDLVATAHAEAGISGSAKFELTLDTKKPINPNFTKNFVVTKPTYGASARVEVRGSLLVGPSVKVEVANSNAFEASLMLHADSVNWIEFQLKGFAGREDAPSPNALIKFAGACPNPHYIEFDMSFELRVVLTLGGKWIKESEKELFKVNFAIASGCWLKARSRSTQKDPEGNDKVYNQGVRLFLDTTPEANGLSSDDFANALREELNVIIGGGEEEISVIANISLSQQPYTAIGADAPSGNKLAADLVFVDAEEYENFDKLINQLKVFSFNPTAIPQRDGYNIAPKILPNKEYENIKVGLALDSASSVTLSFLLLAVAALLAL